jgi:hypothetical protein
MAVLATLSKDRLGAWATIGDYLADLRRRETNSVAALALVLSAASDEQRELGQGDGLQLLVDLASDLRVPKASRVAAARCAIEAGASGDSIGALFVGAGDLATDPRLGACAKKLVEEGLPAALRVRETREVSLQAGAFARATHAGASVVGHAQVKDLLASALKDHAGAIAASFAMGASDLPPAHRERWAKLLRQQRTANRSAPAAARRLGLAPPWPPNLPDAFAQLVREADEATAHVTAQEAAVGEVKGSARKGAPAQPAGHVGAPLEPRRQGPHAAAPSPAVPASARPSRPSLVEVGKKIAPPIKASPFRRPRGTITEGPAALPPKPMPPLTTRHPPDVPQSARSSSPETPVAAPLRRAFAAQGPFAARLQALFDDRPEAVERLCAAMEARAALLGCDAALEELERELSRARWRDRRACGEQLGRLAAAAEAAPPPWRAAARLLLARLS